MELPVMRRPLPQTQLRTCVVSETEIRLLESTRQPDGTAHTANAVVRLFLKNSLETVVKQLDCYRNGPMLARDLGTAFQILKRHNTE